MARASGDPLSLASEALTYLLALAQKGAEPGRMQRETDAVIAGWREDVASNAALPQAAEAVEMLHDQLATGIEQTVEMVADLEREDAAGLRAGERLLASLRAARDAAAAARLR